MCEIVKVVPKEDFQLDVTLDNGEKWLFDAKPYLKGKLYEELWDTDLFRQVRIDEFGGLVWPNGADLCVDSILAVMPSHGRAPSVAQ